MLITEEIKELVHDKYEYRVKCHGHIPKLYGKVIEKIKNNKKMTKKEKRLYDRFFTNGAGNFTEQSFYRIYEDGLKVYNKYIDNGHKIIDWTIKLLRNTPREYNLDDMVEVSFYWSNCYLFNHSVRNSLHGIGGIGYIINVPKCDEISLYIIKSNDYVIGS